MPDATPSLPKVLPLGADAIVVRFSLTPAPEANAAAQVYAQMLEHAPPHGTTEIVPSLASVMLRFDPLRTSRETAAKALAKLLAGRDWRQVTPPPATRRWIIPAAFGGEFGSQLGDAAQAAGISEQRALQELTATRLRVLAIGFAPGQPYLGLLPEHWNFARLPSLTPQVPAGALVVAVRQVVLFANPSATGWRHIGQSAFRPFRPEASEPFPLRVGDEVMFEPVAHGEFSALLASGAIAADTARLELLT